MFSFALADKLDVIFNCFCSGKAKYDDDSLSSPPVSIIPADLSLCITNLTPNTDNVRSWITLVIGRDGHYLLVSIPENSVWKKIVNVDILDTEGNKLSPTSKRFLDDIWDTVKDKPQAMLYANIGDEVFFMNVHVIRSVQDVIIGAVAFVRPLADIMKEIKTIRSSIDKIQQPAVSKSTLFGHADIL
jgi:hypothetical protein